VTAHQRTDADRSYTAACDEIDQALGWDGKPGTSSPLVRELDDAVGRRLAELGDETAVNALRLALEAGMSGLYDLLVSAAAPEDDLAARRDQGPVTLPVPVGVLLGETARAALELYRCAERWADASQTVSDQFGDDVPAGTWDACGLGAVLGVLNDLTALLALDPGIDPTANPRPGGEILAGWEIAAAGPSGSAGTRMRTGGVPVCSCRFYQHHPAHHDLMLQIEDRPDVWAELAYLLVTWDSTVYEEEITPTEWPEFFACHNWRDPVQVERWSTVLQDCWRSTHAFYGGQLVESNKTRRQPS
jgi:hypothetical protein